MFRKKNKPNMNKIFKSIAREEGISVEEVRNEMQYAIDSMMKENDLEAQVLRKKLFGNATPTPEEFITKVSEEIQKGTL